MLEVQNPRRKHPPACANQDDNTKPKFKLNPNAITNSNLRRSIGQLSLEALDLADTASIRALGARHAQPTHRNTYDALILNAGLTPSDSSERTRQGLELAFGTNYLGNVLLTELLVGSGAMKPQVV